MRTESEANPYNSRRYAMLNRWDPDHLDIVDKLLVLPPGTRVLEVGAGAGHLTKHLAARGVDIVGIDVNPQAPEVAGTELIQEMSADAMRFADEEFDAIVSFHAIEHIPALDRAAAEMARVLKPGGKALLVYPAEPFQGIFAIPTSVILYGTPLKARQIHCNWLWPSRVRDLFARHGMVEEHRQFKMLKSPQFVSLLRKK